MNANGKGMTVWQQYDGAHYSIYARSYSTGTLGTVKLIETGSGNADSPQVAVDSNGNAIAVWRQYDGAHYSIYTNRYSAGAWGTAKLLETANGDAQTPQIAMDNNGNAIAVWRQYDGAHYSIYTNRYSAGAWGTAKLLETANGDAQTPQIAMDGSGDAIAVWVQVDNVYRLSVYAANYTNTFGWGPVKLLENSNVDAINPQVAIDSNGNAAAVWEQGGSIYANLYTFTYIIRNSEYVLVHAWGTAKLLENSPDWAVRPQVAMDDNGNIIAVWAQAGNLYANRFSTGTHVTGAWGTAKLLETSAGWARDPQIAMDNNSNGVAIWAQAGSIYADQYSLGTWGGAKLLETGTKDAFVPKWPWTVPATP